MLDVFWIAIADDEFGPALQDRPDELLDILAAILIVAVGIDDDICAFPERIIHARREGVPEAPVGRKPDQVVDTVIEGHLCGSVSTPIIDDQDLDRIDPIDLAGQVAERGGEGGLFIEARNLDDQFQLRSPAAVAGPD